MGSEELDTQQASGEEADEKAPLESALDLPGAGPVPLDVRDIPLDEIAELENIRPTYHGIEGLAETMHLEGQLQPCLVRPAPEDATHGKPYELIFGYRRKRAAEYLRERGIEGWETLRCEVREVEGQGQLAKTIVENFQREELSPVAEARAMLALKHSQDPPLSNAEVARQLGCDPSHVSHRISMLIGLALPEQRAKALPEAMLEHERKERKAESGSVEERAEEAKVSHELDLDAEPQPSGELEKAEEQKPRVDILEMVDRGEISASAAEVIASLDDREQQEKLAVLTKRHGWSVKKVASWAADVKEHKLDEGLDADLGPVEMVQIEDAVEMPRLVPRSNLSEGELERLNVYILLRNGMDREVLDYLEEEKGYPYERLWDYVRALDPDEVAELKRRLIYRYIGAAHRFHSWEASLREDVESTDPDELEAAQGGGSGPLELPRGREEED